MHKAKHDRDPLGVDRVSAAKLIAFPSTLAARVEAAGKLPCKLSANAAQPSGAVLFPPAPLAEHMMHHDHLDEASGPSAPFSSLPHSPTLTTATTHQGSSRPPAASKSEWMNPTMTQLTTACPLLRSWQRSW
jgi:hypothetical protein